MNKVSFMDNILSWGTSKLVDMATQNPDQIGKFVADLAVGNSQMRTFLKSINWSASGFGNLVQKAITGFLCEFKNREPFSITDEERINKFTEIYPELLGYNCLSIPEARILAAGMAQFTGKEIQKMFKLDGQMTVEQIQQIAEDSHKKFVEVAGKVNVGITASTVEKSSDIDLDSIARQLENRF